MRGSRQGFWDNINRHQPLALALLGTVAVALLLVSLLMGGRVPPMDTTGVVFVSCGLVVTVGCWWLYFHLRRRDRARDQNQGSW
jgi:ABC-type nickel/cobalt efflux system permease component RcnA